MAYGNDVRLGLTLLLNAAVLAAAIYAARRWTADPVQRAIDALLLWFAIQYAAVCLPGLLGILSPLSMTLAALLLSGTLIFFAKKKSPPHSPTPSPNIHQSDRRPYLAAALFVGGFLAALIFEFASLPALDTDAMTYHIPAAIHWLQTGRISLFPVWFFNPANTFSPLAGSTFIAWLYAPMGCDVLARFAQVPALLLLCLGVIQLCRALGLTPIGASLVAVAAALSRPFISEVTLAKDDIFLAAFFIVAVAGFSDQTRADTFGPWRIGIALGLALATKYTALFSLPLLLLLIETPRRNRLRAHVSQISTPRNQFAIITGLILLLAGPWFLRNLWLTGNPLYPINVSLFGKTVFPSLLTPARSLKLRSLHDITQVLAGRYHSLPPVLLLPVLIGWLAAAARWKQWLRDPLLRICVLGPILGVALFLIKSPYPEVRFLFPSMVLMFAAAGAGAHHCLPPIGEWIYAALLALLSVATCFAVAREMVATMALAAVLVTAAGLGLHWCDQHLAHRRARPRLYAAIAAALLLWASIYVYWNIFIFHELRGYIAIHRPAWASQYAEYAPAWDFIQQEIPPDATIAYTNTHIISPLYGFHPSRRLIYSPVRADIPDFLHLPAISKPLPGEEIDRAFSEVLCTSPDRALWLARLREANADYLFITHRDPIGDPPELHFAQADPVHFTQLFHGGAVTIYRITRQ